MGSNYTLEYACRRGRVRRRPGADRPGPPSFRSDGAAMHVISCDVQKYFTVPCVARVISHKAPKLQPVYSPRNEALDLNDGSDPALPA